MFIRANSFICATQVNCFIKTMKDLCHHTNSSHHLLIMNNFLTYTLSYFILYEDNMHKLLSISMPGTSLRSLCTFNSFLSFVCGVCIYVPRGQRRTSSVHLVLERGDLSCNLEPGWQSVDHSDPPVSTPQHWITGMRIHAQLFMWVLVIQTQPACLHSKYSYFLSPALASFNPVTWKLPPPSLCRREDGSRRLAQPAQGPISVEAVQKVQAKGWDPVCVSGTTKAIIYIPYSVWDWS